MGGFLILLPLSILLIVWPFILTFLRTYRFFNQNSSVVNREEEDILDSFESKTVRTFKQKKYDYPEILFMGIAPLLGLVFIPIFKNDIPAFDENNVWILGLFVIPGYLAFWISRYRKEKVSPLVFYLLPAGMMIGILVYVPLFIHFIAPLTLAGLILPFFGFALYAPLPAILFNIMELNRHSRLADELLKQEDNASYTKVFKVNWSKMPIYFLIPIGYLMFVVLLLFLIGNPNAIIDLFHNSSDFLLSKDKWSF